MTAIRIRVAGRDDVPLMSALGRQTFTDTYGSTATATDIRRHVEENFSETAMRREIAQAAVRYLLASDGTVCAGFVKLRDSEPPQPVPAGSALEVQQLYVATDFQRMGIGRLLLDHAVSIGKDRDKEGLWLSVWTHADWATTFYFDYGFTAVCDVPFMLGSAEFVDHLMWMPLART